MKTNQILKQLNLLFIDDNYNIGAEIYSIFSSIFKSVTLAQDTESALAHYKKNTTDIIISDIEMPGTDGLTLIENIRLTDSFIPIIFLTAHTQSHYLMRAANLQIDGYVTKPLNFKKLQVALDRAVTRLEGRISSIAITEQIEYHPLFKTLKVDNQEISLGNKEQLLLDLLILKNHKLISKQEIQEAVWADNLMSESALKNLLGELRRKLKYNVIENKPARGWILNIQSND